MSEDHSLAKFQDVAVLPSQEKDTDKRRSQRVMIQIPVRIRMQSSGKSPVYEDTQTSVVNAHGALVPLAMKVTTGQLLTLVNAKTTEELSCRVVYVGPVQSGKTPVGIEFMKPSPRFWRIAFPPEDWSPRSPEAKRLR